MSEIKENIEKIREFNGAINSMDSWLGLASSLQSFQRCLTNIDDIDRVEKVIEIILLKIERETKYLREHNNKKETKWQK